MRRVNITGTPPQDWLDDAESVTKELRGAAKTSLASADYELLLLPSVSSKGDMPSSGKDQLVIASLKNLLLIRAFGGMGETMADIEESKREPIHSPFHALRDLLEGNWDVSKLKALEKTELFRLVTLIVCTARTDAIIEANEDLWRDDRIRDWLLNQFNHKCWYSEARDSVSSIHVDHYRPKGRITDDLTKVTTDGYWWLAFVWSNYKICGQLLNVKKRDVFPFADTMRGNAEDPNSLDLESPILIDPRTDDTRLISYEFEDEETCVAVSAGGNLPDEEVRAKRTIEILGLNRLASLNRKRADFWDDCMIEIANYKGAAGAQPLKLVAQAAARAKLKSMVKYEVEFSSVAEACIHKNAPESLKTSVFAQERAA